MDANTGDNRRTRVRGASLSTVLIVLTIVALCACQARISQPAPMPDEMGGGVMKLENMTAGKAYRDVYGALKELGLNDYRGDFKIYNMAKTDSIGEGSSASAEGQSDGDSSIREITANEEAAPEDLSAVSDESADDASFSETNVRTEGVQEADIVKTDGRYIYAINSQKLSVTEANDGQPELIGEIPQIADSGQVYFEMYIVDGRLIALRQGYNNVRGDVSGATVRSSRADEGKIADDSSLPGKIEYARADHATKTDTTVDIFDISDPAQPKMINSLSQSGSYADSRMIDDILYLVSVYEEFDYSAIAEKNPKTYVPLYASGDEQFAAEPSDINMLPERDVIGYTLISGIDTTGEGSFLSKKSVFGNNFNVYVGKENMYLSAYSSEETTEESGRYRIHVYRDASLLTRVALNDGDAEVAASAKIPGFILNQFSMDEYNGVFRVVTTENENAWIETTELPQIEPDFAPDEASDDASIADSTAIDRASSPGQSSSLFTLNQDLEVIGEIRGIAPNERVYSCRFMEDIAYFVTFRQVDPLFSADLSDPAAPKLIGALKIPGFSEYLHPYAPGLLFGLGRDADEDTGVAGDIKLSMFDISNPADAKEKDKMILQGLRASEAESNHKAIVVNAGKRLIAFPSDRCYIVCGYDVETGFSRRATISLYEDNAAYFNGYYYGGEGLRGLFIGNVFYAISPNSVNAYDMDNDFAKLGTASVGDGAMPVNRYAYYLPREYPGNPGDGAEIIPFKGGIEDSIE